MKGVAEKALKEYAIGFYDGHLQPHLHQMQQG